MANEESMSMAQNTAAQARDASRTHSPFVQYPTTSSSRSGSREPKSLTNEGRAAVKALGYLPEASPSHLKAGYLAQIPSPDPPGPITDESRHSPAKGLKSPTATALPRTLYPAFEPASKVEAKHKFASSGDARRFRAERVPRDVKIPNDEEGLAHLIATAPDWVDAVYDAIIDVSSLRDNPGAAYNLFVAQKGRTSKYSYEELHAAAWRLIDAVIDGASNGYLVCMPRGCATSDTEKTMKSVDRILEICKCLRLEKTSCKELIEGDDRAVSTLVYAPVAIAESKALWRHQNLRRANRGKNAVLDAAEAQAGVVPLGGIPLNYNGQAKAAAALEVKDTSTDPSANTLANGSKSRKRSHLTATMDVTNESDQSQQQNTPVAPSRRKKQRTMLAELPANGTVQSSGPSASKLIGRTNKARHPRGYGITQGKIQTAKGHWSGSIEDDFTGGAHGNSQGLMQALRLPPNADLDGPLDDPAQAVPGIPSDGRSDHVRGQSEASREWPENIDPALLHM